jgi:hypothetical protein
MKSYTGSGISQRDSGPPSRNSGIAASDQELASSLAKQLESNLNKVWVSTKIAAQLTTLLDHYIPYEMLTKYSLGRIMKAIEKEATRKGKWKNKIDYMYTDF